MPRTMRLMPMANKGCMIGSSEELVSEVKDPVMMMNATSKSQVKYDTRILCRRGIFSRARSICM